MDLLKEQIPHGAIIKKGKAAYEPAPIFDGEHFDEPSAEENGEQTFSPQVFSEEERQEMIQHANEEAQAILSKAKEDADSLVLEAQKKSNKLIEQSKLYCQTAHANAEREGYALGREKGRVEAREELKNLLIAARETLKETKTFHDRLAESMEPGLAKLAVDIAGKVVEEEVKVNPETVLHLVKAHLDKAKERDRVILRVHPDDYETVKKNKGLLAQMIPEVKTLDLVAEAKIERGSCMIETNLGTVDANFSTQLDAVRAAFLRADKEAAKPAPAAEEPDAPQG